MRALLIITAALLVALLLADVGWPAFYDAGWTPPAQEGRCWAVLCVVNQQGYTEVSWNEYAPPPPVVPNGAPYYP